MHNKTIHFYENWVDSMILNLKALKQDIEKEFGF